MISHEFAQRQLCVVCVFEYEHFHCHLMSAERLMLSSFELFCLTASTERLMSDSTDANDVKRSAHMLACSCCVLLQLSLVQGCIQWWGRSIEWSFYGKTGLVGT